MKTKNTFTIHTELLDGKLDGARNIYMDANPRPHATSSSKSIVKKIKDRYSFSMMFHLRAQAERQALFFVVQAMAGMIGKMLTERNLAR